MSGERNRYMQGPLGVVKEGAYADLNDGVIYKNTLGEGAANASGRR